MKIAVASDHAGFRLKKELLQFLQSEGYEIADHGTDSETPVDYPRFCAEVARSVTHGEADFGIVLGGSGQGEAISANKIKGVRAALCNDPFTAKLSRAHNDANVLAMGARIVAPELAFEIVKVFLTTGFDGGRHVPRIEQIVEIEREEREKGV